MPTPTISAAQSSAFAPRVLVVDDDADIRDALNLILLSEGFTVRSAANGFEAVGTAWDFHPQVVFLDVWMPGKSGIDTCQELRAGPCPQPTPIYGVTADRSQLANVSQCFDQVLLKPVDIDVLVGLVNRWLAAHTECALDDLN
jgi:DNA-binding response OmpR family regulator